MSWHPPEPRYSAEGVTCAECMANVHHHVEVGGKAWCEHHVPTPPDPWDAATTDHVVASTLSLAYMDAGDRWGTLMGIGFGLCDHLAIRGEYVPGELKYRPAGLPTADELDGHDVESAEEAGIDPTTWYLWQELKLHDADDIRRYLLDVWEPAYQALEAAGEDY